MAALLYLLLPMRRGVVPPGFNLVLRAIELVRPWGMIEVSMLGILVTIVKMVSPARVVPDAALFGFAALTLLIICLRLGCKQLRAQLDVTCRPFCAFLHGFGQKATFNGKEFMTFEHR
jgi:hypothetical protein